MADPLSQLRQFHINGREIKEHGDFIVFGDHGWPKTVKTNYQIYSTDDDKNKKDYYTLECLLYFLKNMDVAHHHYVKQAGRDNIPVVHRPDRKSILAYLKGEQQTSSGIDKNAPIPSLRLPAAEIYKKVHHSTGDPQPSTSSQSSNSQSQNDSVRGESSSSATKKRPHDPEEEKKFREEFAAKLYEPSNKKLATVIPVDSVDKGGESAQGSAAISKFGAEKLAALRAKHLAVKRTTIVDADMELGKPGSGTTDLSSKEEIMFAMDSDPSKLIKSKEKIWRTRSSILQAQSKNFARTVVPMLQILEKTGDPNRKVPQGSMPPVPTDMQMNPYQQSQQQQSQQQTHTQQQSIQRNSYNRYDQERFVKLDIGVEIDTKKSFVGGVANGLSGYNQVPPSQPPAARPMGGPPMPTPPTMINGSMRTSDVDNRHRSSSTPSSRSSHKRVSATPIIIIPATTTSLINMYNAATILQDLTYVDGTPNRPRESDILIQRKKPDGTHAAYKIIDNPLKLDTEDWQRVVAVFVQGPTWQFKGWPWGGSPVEIFSHIKGYHIKWDETKTDDNVAKWNVHIIELSRNRRHLDKANLLKFWLSLDSFMAKYKTFLKF